MSGVYMTVSRHFSKKKKLVRSYDLFGNRALSDNFRHLEEALDVRQHEADANILDTIRRAVQKPRVLIVEDNHIIASNVGQILKDYACDVVGPEVTVGGALKILRSAKIDIALVDFILEDGPAKDCSTILTSGISLSPSARGLTSRRCILILRY